MQKEWAKRDKLYKNGLKNLNYDNEATRIELG